MIKVTTKKFRGKKAADILRSIWDSTPTWCWWDDNDTILFVTFVSYYSVVDGVTYDNEGDECQKWHYHLIEETYAVTLKGVDYTKRIDTWCDSAPDYVRYTASCSVSQIAKYSSWSAANKLRVIYPDIVK